MKYHRKIFLNDRPFQLKFSFIVTLAASIPTLIFPIMMWKMLGIINLYTDEIGGISINENSFFIALTLILWQVIFSLLIFIVCLLQSHKVAGPIWKTKKYMGEMREGNNKFPLSFRREDYLHDFASEINETIDYLRKK